MKSITEYCIDESSSTSLGLTCTMEDFYPFINIICEHVDNVSNKQAEEILKFTKKFPKITKWINDNYNNELSNWMDNTL